MPYLQLTVQFVLLDIDMIYSPNLASWKLFFQTSTMCCPLTTCYTCVVDSLSVYLWCIMCWMHGKALNSACVAKPWVQSACFKQVFIELVLLNYRMGKWWYDNTINDIMNCNAAFFSLKSAVARTRAYACRGGFVLLVEIILSLQFHHQIQVHSIHVYKLMIVVRSAHAVSPTMNLINNQTLLAN